MQMIYDYSIWLRSSILVDVFLNSGVRKPPFSAGFLSGRIPMTFTSTQSGISESLTFLSQRGGHSYNLTYCIQGPKKMSYKCVPVVSYDFFMLEGVFCFIVVYRYFLGPTGFNDAPNQRLKEAQPSWFGLKMVLHFLRLAKGNGHQNFGNLNMNMCYFSGPYFLPASPAN